MNEIQEKLKLLPDDPGVYIMLDKDGNVIELKEDEDAMDTFNLARMDADDDRHRAFSEEAEFQDSGFDIEDAPEDAGADIDVDFDDE